MWSAASLRERSRQLRVSMPTNVAVHTPVAQSLQQMEAVNLDRKQTAGQRQQDIEVQARESHAVRMG